MRPYLVAAVLLADVSTLDPLEASVTTDTNVWLR